jgi:hypothetical protein
MLRLATLPDPGSTPTNDDLAQPLVERLERDGIIRLPHLVGDEALRDMQRAFSSRLQWLRWNNVDGYERTERYRYMVQDVLTLAQGFVDIALHPLVQAIMRAYVGPDYTLCETKGWRSLPTKRDFHGWHGDAWYDQRQVTDRVPREVKLAMYLTDVSSGAFQYVLGSHGRPPRHLSPAEAAELPLDRVDEVLGPAGSAFLFDTSGIHRQGVPILEPRQAVFYNYHEPTVPLQEEDVAYYRYHPLLLQAAFLGGLSVEDARVLGFGDKTNYQPNFTRRPSYPVIQAILERAHTLRIFTSEWSGRLLRRGQRLLGR